MIPPAEIYNNSEKINKYINPIIHVTNNYY